MKNRTYYEGPIGDTVVLQGTGNPNHISSETTFLKHNGLRIAQLLREESLKAAGINDRVLFNAMEFKSDQSGERTNVSGFVDTVSKGMGKALAELQWKSH